MSTGSRTNERGPPPDGPVPVVSSLVPEAFIAFPLLVGTQRGRLLREPHSIAQVRAPDHADAIVALALDMQTELSRICDAQGLGLAIRIGIDCGPVVAGVIGRRKFIYDLWGDTVNTASRMESHGLAGRIHVTEAVYQRVRGRFAFEPRGEIEIKGKGRIATWLLVHDAEGAG